ncbi:MAG: hypothetical protein QXO69_01800 [archaeon]
MNTEALTKNLPSLIGLAFLVFILLFLLANFGYIRPCDVPGFTSVYYAVKGQPRIALVSGSDGYGDPDKLRDIIIARTTRFPEEISVADLKTGGALDNYQLVIVDHAKTMDTATLQAFRDYVQKGGRLVWIADAGTGLGGTDYVCERVDFAYLPAVNYTDANGSTYTQCASEWVTVSPDDPEQLGSGICGRTYADIVVNYTRINKTTYESAFSHGIFPCPDVDKPYQVRGNERIEACLSNLMGQKPTKAAVEQNCSYEAIGLGINYWNRGGTLTETSKVTSAFNFGATVLGLDYIADKKATSLYLQPVDSTHVLVKGYETGVDVSKYFGASNFSIVDTTGFEYRTKTVMALRVGGSRDKSYPAILTSSPVGPTLAKGGLVIYYAFPPEDTIELQNGQYVGAVNLIDNLMDFTVC